MVKIKENNSGVVHRDFNGRTCLQFTTDESTEDEVIYIPLDMENGFQVFTTSRDSFTQRFTPLPNYPIEKACQLFLNYALSVGATEEVLYYLGLFINISSEDYNMAAEKRDSLPTAKTKSNTKTGLGVGKLPSAKKSPAKKTVAKKAPAKKAPAKKAPAKKAPAKKAPASDTIKVRGSTTRKSKGRETKLIEGSYNSAASMFKGLIMEGGKTDDQIFAEVQKEFGLDDNKRGYVKWYRNHLKSKGENPPEPK